MLLKWIMVFFVGLLTATVNAEEKPSLKGKQDRISYGVGVDMARNLKRQAIEADVGSMEKGLKDLLSGGKLLFPEADLQAAMAAFHVESAWRETEPKKASPRVSYGMAVDAARTLKLYDIKVDSKLMAEGVRAGFSGEKLPLTDEELRTAGAALQLQMKQNHPKISRVKRTDKRASETVFSTSNKTKEGVVNLPSGLQYKVLKAGEGKKPLDADMVEVRYRGTFIDGTEFGKSPEEKPMTFKVIETIPGWREALKLMPAGSKWEVFIPSRLAFRSRGWGLSGWPTLPLITELELLAIQWTGERKSK